MQDTVEQNDIKSVLALMYSQYPDVVNINQLCTMLGNISAKTAYKLLHTERITYFKIGRIYKIPKVNIIAYIISMIYNEEIEHSSQDLIH